MSVQIPNKEIEKKPAESAVLSTTPAVSKPKPVELEFVEGDAVFHKRTDD
jgi:hypothetical protein